MFAILFYFFELSLHVGLGEELFGPLSTFLALEGKEYSIWRFLGG